MNPTKELYDLVTNNEPELDLNNGRPRYEWRLQGTGFKLSCDANEQTHSALIERLSKNRHYNKKARIPRRSWWR